MKRVRTKICGLCSTADAKAAAQAGADAVGLVFHAPSARAVTLAQAQSISAALPPFITRVALFLDAPAAEISHVVEHLRPDILQFHGREEAAFCRSFGVPYIKAVPMGEDGIDLAAWQEAYHDAGALLLDAHRAGDAGGSGRRFGWHEQARMPTMPIIVAGGIDADNVCAAIRRFRPHAVDVSSGVESAPGVKDGARMHALVEAVLTCCRQEHHDNQQ